MGRTSALRKASRAVIYLLLAGGGVIMVVPLLWMVLASFKTLPEVLSTPPTWLPQSWSPRNYVEVFAEFPFARYLLNSVIVSAVCIVSVLFTSATAGYALAKFPSRTSKAVLILFLASIVVPFQTQMIPLFQLTLKLHINNTLAGVILPWVIDVFGVFLMRQFILTLPDELIQAARIDGAGEARIFWSIILPLTRPALATVGILTFLGTWEEFLWPLIVTDDEHARTLPIGLQSFSSLYGTAVQLQMTGAVIATVPLFLVFVVFQRQIIAGIATSGLKG